MSLICSLRVFYYPLWNQNMTIIHKLLVNHLHFLEEQLQYDKMLAKMYWEKSNKSIPSTEVYFHKLNDCKNRIRDLLKRIKKVQTQIKKVKLYGSH